MSLNVRRNATSIRALAANLALAGAVLFAHPEVKAADQPKLTIADCQTILSGLNALDGRQELAKDGSSITVAYQFGNAGLRLAIQQNISALNVARTNVIKVQQDIFREIAGADATEIKPNTPELARYQKAMAEVDARECTVTLVRIRAVDLKLDKNEIPGSVLGALDKILDK